jgi:hypothetical protein
MRSIIIVVMGLIIGSWVVLVFEKIADSRTIKELKLQVNAADYNTYEERELYKIVQKEYDSVVRRDELKELALDFPDSIMATTATGKVIWLHASDFIKK